MEINTKSKFGQLLEASNFKVPSKGEVIKGTVISASKAEVKLDINGMTTGVVRGKEVFSEADDYVNLQPGDEVEATVIDLENENGEIELSFRFAGQIKAWEKIKTARAEGTAFTVKILDANKGGLMIKVGSIKGFLPVSQLTPEHYPRVEGGDKNRILEVLKSYINKDFTVRVMDMDEREEKLIVSEKMAWEEGQKEVMSKYAVAQKVKGKITAVTDFGAFVEFDEKMEGLVHISELAWQRIDDPHDVVKVGDEIEAEIISIEGTKIFLSMKKLQKDPWANVGEKYQVGQIVKAKILKVNPFGFFVELDPEIHGLVHVSELSEKSGVDVKELGKMNEIKEFKIISIEPKEHRLGLSLKAMSEKEPRKAKSAAADLAAEASAKEAAKADEGKKAKKVKKEKKSE